MNEKTASKRSLLKGPLYLDASALAKLYLSEAESEALEAVLLRRRDLWVSDLSVTEVVSAAARRRRIGEMTLQQVRRLHGFLLDDLADDAYLAVQLDAEVHREAERLLVGFNGPFLRAGDALHLALARSVQAETFVTFDRRLSEAAFAAGLRPFPAES